MYSFVQFTKRNVNFGVLSLNARGIRTLEKRKALFHWLFKEKAEVVFLQETYSSPEVENVWKTQWKGDLYFAHGSEHSRGVLILVKERLNFELKSCTHDKQGRYIILIGNVQEQPFVFVNIYAPNKTSEQCIFFQVSPLIFSMSAVESDKVIRFHLCCLFYLWKYLHVILDKTVTSTA